MGLYVNVLSIKDNSKTTADNKEIPEVMHPGDNSLYGCHAAPQLPKFSRQFVRFALSDGYLGGDPDLLLRRNHRPEPVHVLPEPCEPVLRVAVVGSVAAGASLLVADDVSRLYGRVVLHEALAEVGRKPEGLLEVGAVVQRVLADLYLYVRRLIVITSF